MFYFFSEGPYPISALLPLNAARLYSMRRLTRGIDAAVKSNMSGEWLLPYMRPKGFNAGEIMIARGEYATAAYYIVSGEVELVETGETFGKAPCSAK